MRCGSSMVTGPELFDNILTTMTVYSSYDGRHGCRRSPPERSPIDLPPRRAGRRGAPRRRADHRRAASHPRVPSAQRPVGRPRHRPGSPGHAPARPGAGERLARRGPGRAPPEPRPPPLVARGADPGRRARDRAHEEARGAAPLPHRPRRHARRDRARHSDAAGRARGARREAVKALRARIVAQFARPSGWTGRLAGFVMEHRPSKRERNRRTVELLDVHPDHRVLELGFGPGLALGWIAERTPVGEVVGLEHSETMLRLAARRHAAAIASGRMRLLLGRAEELRDLGPPFDRIFGVNVWMFWHEPVEVLCGLREHLRPGGILALTYQPRHASAKDADATRAGERLAELLRAAGLEDPRIELLPMKPVNAVCVLGRRPVLRSGS